MDELNGVTSIRAFGRIMVELRCADKWNGYRGAHSNKEETIATKEPQLKGAKASSEQVAPTNGYIDLYLLPVPKKNLAPDRRQATIFVSVAREYGALNYREFIGDDLFPKGVVSFTRAIELGRGEVLTVAVAEFKSRSAGGSLDFPECFLDSNPRGEDTTAAIHRGLMKLGCLTLSVLERVSGSSRNDSWSIGLAMQRKMAT